MIRFDEVLMTLAACEIIQDDFLVDKIEVSKSGSMAVSGVFYDPFGTSFEQTIHVSTITSKIAAEIKEEENIRKN